MVDSSIFLFDLETTGFSRVYDQICQLVAIPLNKESDKIDPDKIFNIYVLPSQPFHPKASQVNGFSIISTEEGTRNLCKEGNILTTINLEEAYRKLFEYLKDNTPSGTTVTLVGFNCKSFDVPFLRRDCHMHNVQMVVAGRDLCFADAYPFLRRVRYSVLPGLKSMKLQAIHHYLYPDSISKSYHDAVDDALKLRDILLSPLVPLEKLSQFEFA